MTRDRIEEVHNLFHEKVKEIENNDNAGLNRGQLLVEVGNSPGSLIDLNTHTAQAIDGASMAEKDRCIQCRKTFGFCWVVAERPLSKDTVVEWAKAEQPGKCAEPWLWQTCVRIMDAAQERQ